MKQYKLICGEYSIKLEAYNQDKLKEEIRSAATMAAVQLNHQHRQEGAGCFEYLSLGCSQVSVVSDDENEGKFV